MMNGKILVRLGNVWAVATAVLLLAASAHAAVLEWDANGALPVDGGTGNWLGGNTWYNDSTLVYQAWADSNDAVFGGTAGTVTLSAAAGPSSLTFNAAGYSVSGSSVVLGGPNITANADAAIASTLGGTVGMAKLGAGMLSLTGSANYSGGTLVSQGTLRLAQGGVAFPTLGSTGQFGSAHTVTVNSGATLQLNATWITGDGLADQVVVNGGTLQFLDSDNYLGNIVLTGGAITTSGGSLPWRTGNWGSGVITVNASAASSTIAGSLTFVGTAAAPTTTFNVADGPAAEDLVMSANTYDHGGFEGQMTLVKDGPGVMSVSGMFNHRGGITVNGGTFVLNRSGLAWASNGQFGSAGSTLTVNAGATMEFAQIATTGLGQVQLLVLNGGTAKFSQDTYQSRIQMTGATIDATGAPGSTHPWRIGNAGNGLIEVYASPTSSTILGKLTLVKTASATQAVFNVADGAAPDDLVISANIGDHPGGYEGMTLVKTGPGRMVLSGNSTFLGGTTISQGTVQFSSATAFGTGAITLGDAGTGSADTALLAGHTGGDLVLARPIVVTNNGTGTATIGGVHTGGRAFFDGLVTINRDVILLGSGNDRTQFRGGIVGTGNITIAGGNRVTWSTTTAVVDGGDGASPYTFVGDVFIVGAGTMLQTNSHEVVPDASNLDVGAGATFRMAYGKNETINGLTGSGTVASVAGNSTLTVQGGNFSGLLTDAAGDAGDTLSLTKIGPGTLTLSNAGNNFDGVVRINGGVLSIDSLAAGNTACALGAMYGNAGYLIFDGGTLQYTGGTVTGINRAFTINAGGATIDIADAATSVTWTDASGAGPIVGPGMLTKAGPGTLVLASPNSYAGNTTVSQGTLIIRNNNSVGTTGTVMLGDAGTGAANVAFLLDGTISGWNFSRPIVVTSNGTGTATIGSSSGSALTILSSSPITLNRDTVFQGSNTDRTTFTGPISGTGNIVIDSGGTPNGRVTFDNNSNSFVGNVTVNPSTIFQLNGTSVVPDASDVTVNGILYFNSSGETIDALNGTGTIQVHPGVNWNAVLTVGSAGGSGTYSGVIQNGGAGASTVALTKTGAGMQILNSGSGNAMSGAVTVDGGTLRLAGARGFNEGYFQNQTNTYAINANGTLELASAWNSRSNAAYIVNGGTIHAASGNDFNYVDNLTMTGGQITAAAGSGFRTAYFFNATWTINGSATGSTISSPVGLVYQAGVGTQLTLDVADGAAPVDLLFSGRVYDVSPYLGAGLVKAGPGVMSLTGSNTYIGGTTVNAGTLLVNNTAGSGVGTGDVTVASDATLGGSGTIGLPADASNVTVNAGGHLAPGNSPGILTIYGDLTLDPGSFFDVELAGTDAGSGYDQVDVHGGVSLADANLDVSLLFAPDLADQFVLVNNDGADTVGGTFVGLPEGAIVRSAFGGNDYAFAITYQGLTGNDVVLTAVPEPATWTTLLVGLLGAALWGWRRAARPLSR